MGQTMMIHQLACDAALTPSEDQNKEVYLGFAGGVNNHPAKAVGFG